MTTTHTTTDETPIYTFDAADSKRGLWARAKELSKYGYLLRSLVMRELKARYKNSFLGVLWSLLTPLGLMLIFTAIFTAQGGQLREYPIFILTGMIPWQFFSGALISGTTAVIGNSSLIKKVYFPRELLPIASLLSNLVNFLIAFGVLIIFLYIFGIGLTIHVLWVPIILLTQIIFTLGLCLLLGAITVLYRDVLMILNVVMLAWFFITPIIYPLSTLSKQVIILGRAIESARIMRWLNPMASIVDAYRTVLWGTVVGNGDSRYITPGPVSMDPGFFIRTFVTSLIIFIFGYFVFSRLEHLFGEKL